MWSRRVSFIILVFILLAGGFFRFYKLDWGEGHFFHPDEYHIAAAVNQLNFPSQMNPHFFSYGSLIVYQTSFTKLLAPELDPILIARFYSALFSSLTILIVFLIAQILFSKKLYSYLTALLVALTPGLIQQAHFATPESILTFWLFFSLYFWLKYHQKNRLKFLYLAAASLGLSIGTKITALCFLPILILLPITKHRLKLLKKPLRLFELIILPLFTTILIFLLVYPYSLLDWPGFRHSMNYETGVGRGQPVVFYTRQFINTIPILFQSQKIFPYGLGIGVLLLGTIGFFLSLKSRHLRPAVAAFLLLFLPNAFLFAKWTRFMVPAFPFFALFTALLVSKIKNRPLLTASLLLLALNSVWALSFFSIYLRPDVRITATKWISTRLPANSIILTEAGNMLEVPLNNGFQKITFDFYGLEENLGLQRELPELLSQADYFIVQSRRIFANHQRLPAQFPKTARFYNLLFSDRLGFMKIKEFSSYPLISDEMAEETWSVFDHPVIRIYQKTQPFTEKDYESFLKI